MVLPNPKFTTIKNAKVELWHAHTPDISKFRFNVWEPIWCMHAKTTRFLHTNEIAGEEFTYYIRIEGRHPKF